MPVDKDGKEIDLEKLSLADLKKLALEEAEHEEPERKVVTAPQEKDDEPLDNSGDGEPEEFIIRREIDLEDGSGVQVFTGRGETELAALKDLNDKLYTAHTNASRALREIQRKNPKQPDPPAEKTFSEDEEYVFAQQFQKKPSEAFKTLFKEATGIELSEFKSTHAAFKAYQDAQAREQRSLAVQTEFVNAHPDYIGDESNGARMRDWVQSHNYTEFTEDNLEKAYQDLKASGLLNLKTEEADVATDAERKEAERIALTERNATQQRSSKRGSTVTARGRAPVIKTEPSQDDLYSMPMEKLKDLANKQMSAA